MSVDKHNHHTVIIPSLNDKGKLGILLKQRIIAEDMPGHLFTYPCREWTIDRAALMLATYVDTQILGEETGRSVSFVGYGTGSLIMRYFLTHYELLPARRCIIVADPQHPADRYRSRKPGRWAHHRYGPVIDQLAQGPQGFPANCGIPPIPFGVIVTGVSYTADMDRISNSKTADSLYTPEDVLRAARDVVYVAQSCRTKKAASELETYISSFLHHGWFRGD